MWSPTGKARGTLLHAPVGRHPGQTLPHSSTAKGRGLLLPGDHAATGGNTPNLFERHQKHALVAEAQGFGRHLALDGDPDFLHRP